MILPITFRNVPFSVAGSSKYKGDLILTPEVIYYFPHVDVANKRFSVIAIVLLVLVGPFLAFSATYAVCVLAAVLGAILIVLGLASSSFLSGLIVEVVSSSIKRGLELNREFKGSQSYIHEQNDEMQPSQIVASPLPANLYPIILYPTLWYPLILDSALLVLQENQSLSRHSLPAPIRFSKGKIRRLSLSFTGLMTIETEFDMKNKFRIGILRKGVLRVALKEGGFFPEVPRRRTKPCS